MLKQITTNKSKVCFGMMNKAKCGFYLPFFDYDNIQYGKIKNELLELQEKYMLSDIFIFKSENGYNAISLDKLPYNTLRNLINESKYICDDYRTLGLKRGVFTLRFGTDKILKEILLGKHNYQKSLSHYLALIYFYNVNVLIHNSEFDGNLNLKIKAYRSEKNGFLTVKKL